MTDTLRRCDACAAPVPQARVLCPRCGVDVDAPEAPIVWPEMAVAFQPRPSQRRHHGRRLRLLVALVLVLAAAIALVVLRANTAAEADVPVLPAAQRDTSEENGQDISAIGTARAAGADDSNPKAMLDGDTATAWFGEAPTLGFVTREQVALTLSQPAWVSRLVIANGVHDSLAGYDAHGRIRQVELMFDGGQTHTATLLDIGRIAQQIVLPEPILTTSLRITVLGVYPGQQHRDVAVTALEVRGYPPTPGQAVIAQQRAADAPAVDPGPQTGR